MLINFATSGEMECILNFENMSMQYLDFLMIVKIKNFVLKKFDIFTQNIDCRYTLEWPHQGGSKKYQ